MHGLKTMNHKLIMPALIFIPLSSVGIVIALVVTITGASALAVTCSQEINYYGQTYSRCDNTAATVAGGVLVAVIIFLAIALGIWIAAWISFYKAYKYIMQPRNNQQTQQVPLQPQQGYPPQQGFAPQPQQGFEAPPPYSGVPAADPAYPVKP